MSKNTHQTQRPRLIEGSIGLIMALPAESQQRFESQHIFPYYSGIGKINAAYHATKLIQAGAKIILNLGTAGSSQFKTFDLVEVTTFLQQDMDITPLGFSLGTTPMDNYGEELKVNHLGIIENKGRCATADQFQVGPTRLPCDLVDMEGYAIAKICAIENVPCYSVKFITDGADHLAHKDWEKNLVIGADKLWQYFQLALPQIINKLNGSTT